MTRNVLAKAVDALRDWWLAYDELHGSVLLFVPPFWGGHAEDGTRRLDHIDAIRLAAHLQRLGIWRATPGGAAKAAAFVAKERLTFHPVRGYLNGLEWDGTPRIETWLPRLLGAEDSSYVRDAGSRWLVSAIARVMEPGRRITACLPLASPWEASLGEAIRILGGLWHKELVYGLGAQVASEDIRGAWIVEVAEIDCMTAAQVSRLKTFLRRPSDRHRRAERLRQCVFAITSRSLGSESDAIRCGKIDLDALRAERDQLWAEAFLLYKGGKS